MGVEYKTGYQTVATCDECGAVADSGWMENSPNMPEGWVGMPHTSWLRTGGPQVACSLACAEALAVEMARSLYDPALARLIARAS